MMAHTGNLRVCASNFPDQLHGVLVQAESGDEHSSCSGFVFGDGRYVLTHGVILSALKLTKRPSLTGKLQASPSLPVTFKIVDEKSRTSDCQLAAWWTCSLLNKSARDLYFQGWRFSPDEHDYRSLALMIVLSVDSKKTVSVNCVRDALHELLRNRVATCRDVGTSVLLESTPFGAGSLFLNSWSRGIVSSVSGEYGSLLLCDVHAAPGCEGGALYIPETSSTRRALIGLAILPFSVVRGEAVSLCLCAALHPVISQLLEQSLPPIVDGHGGLDTSIVPSIALLRHGSSWASAVSVDAARGIFITCSHVLQGEGSPMLQWKGGGPPVTSEILFRTSTESAFDLAVVRINSRGPRPPSPRFSQLLKGEAVLVAGYGVLIPPGISSQESLHLSPLVSRGCVSLSSPLMLQTTCAVQSGASGGAVLSYPSCELVGIVVGHMRADNASPLPRDWPRLNFAVPVTTIAPAIQYFLQSGDVRVLKCLEVVDPSAQRLWRLDTHSSSKL